MNIKFFMFLLLMILPLGCSEQQLLDKERFQSDVIFIDHNGNEFSFSDQNGKVLLVSYIYTNCPDICHIITKKMDLLKSDLIKQGIDKDVVYVSISIDPQHDTPERLAEHIKHMKFDTTNWYFLTGSIGTVYKFIATAGIFPKREAKPNGSEEPSDYLKYIISHRDRISLVDQNGYIIKHYKGTTMDYNTIIADIKSLI